MGEHSFKTSLTALAKALMCLAVASPAAYAQNAAPVAGEGAPTVNAQPAAAAERAQVVTVTGTSIRGIAPTGAALKKMSIEDISASGATTATELLRSIPELGSFNATGINTGSNQANFVDQPAIHGIGVGNGGGGLTLILLDGHRLPGAGINQTAPDAGVIPQSALERVEVMADGGSSIYGSDAVAGVINFVTRRRFDGAETNFKSGYGDGYQTKNFSHLQGKTWEGGSLLLDYERSENTALNGTSRAYIVNNQTGVGGPDSRSTNCSPANISTGGVNYALSASGAATAGSSNRCEVNRRNDLYPAQHRDQVFASLKHEVSDTVNLYGSFLFSSRKMATQVAGDGVTSGGLSVTVPSSSPFYLPIAGVSAAPHSVTYNPSRDFAQGFTNNVGTLTSSTVAGANITLPNDWNAQLELNYGLERDDVREHGINQALAMSAAEGGTFNPYGVGAATNPALLAQIGDYQTRYFARQTIKQGRAKFDGPLFAIPGGDVRTALGVDLREEQFQGLTSSGPAEAPAATFTAGGKRKISSVFGEVFVPAVGSANRVPGVHKLDVSLAARYDHYDDVGSTVNPKAGVTWAVVDGAQLRFSAGRSFHAPSLADAGTAIDTRAIHFPCIPGVYIGCGSAQSSDYTVVLAGGNSTLKPETAKTLNIGFDLSPALLNGFKVSATYFRIDYKDVITFPTFGPVVDSAAAYAKYRTTRPAGVSDAQWLSTVAPLLAGFRHDGAVYPDLATLPTAVYDLRRQNFADEYIRGIDFNVGYAFKNSLGKFNVDLSGTRMLKFDQIVPGIAQPLELLGTNYAVRNKARTQFGFANADVTANLFVNYTDGYRNSKISPAQSVSSFTTLDTYLAWNLRGDGLLRDTKLSFNISNLLDKNPPVYLTSGENGITGFDPSASSALGRVVSVALQKRW
ncbi:TonB-dependent receptor [Oxalobacteraceae bacterium]|nr:TonB-dependent receptor [Oxalobacteraceae bacterium]